MHHFKSPNFAEEMKKKVAFPGYSLCVCMREYKPIYMNAKGKSHFIELKGNYSPFAMCRSEVVLWR